MVIGFSLPDYAKNRIIILPGTKKVEYSVKTYIFCREATKMASGIAEHGEARRKEMVYLRKAFMQRQKEVKEHFIQYMLD